MVWQKLDYKKNLKAFTTFEFLVVFGIFLLGVAVVFSTTGSKVKSDARYNYEIHVVGVGSYKTGVYREHAGGCIDLIDAEEDAPTTVCGTFEIREIKH